LKYKLIGENNINSIKETILKNRGVKDIKKYLNLDKSVLNHYSILDNIDIAVEVFNTTIKNKVPIYVVADCDVDGYTSASVIYMNIKNDLNYDNVKYILQNKKEHGLSEGIMSVIKNEQVGLIILPDSGTNDVEECKELSECGFEIIILDHHQKEVENPYAVVVNNQCCDYPNKNFCGVGIVYKFLQALDEENWTDFADQYLDLVAFGNISDVMDLRECETKYIVDIGLRNVSHPFLKALVAKQSYSISNTEVPTFIDVAFYMTPLVNAMIRVGDDEEKNILFKAFIKEYEEFDYKPRKSKNNPDPQPTVETIYERAVRLCVNAKSRQSKTQDKAVTEIDNFYSEQNTKNSFCFVNVSKFNDVPKELTGLIAIKIASKYNKPCLVLRKDSLRSTEEEIFFSGSARNINDGFIDDLKLELESSELFEELQGHSNAFGVTIKKDNVQKAIDYFNGKYSDLEKIFKVDFILDVNTLNYNIAKDIESMSKIFSGFVSEPLFAIENIYVDLCGIDIFETTPKYGTPSKHWKFQSGVYEFIKFKIPEDDEISNIDDFEYSSIILNVVGKIKINTFGGKAVPQVVVEDYKIISKE